MVVDHGPSFSFFSLSLSLSLSLLPGKSLLGFWKNSLRKFFLRVPYVLKKRVSLGE